MDKVKFNKIKTAEDELLAVIAETENASAAIMDSCEVLQGIAVNCGNKDKAILEQVNKIFEACAFQDITGQRLLKVIKSFKNTDVIINQNSDSEQLENGPQLVGKGLSQDDIDKLLTGAK